MSTITDEEKSRQQLIQELTAARQRITELEGMTQEIARRKKADELLQVRLHLSEFAITHSLHELLQKTLDEAEILTNSQIGFFHFLEADQKTLWLQMWSTRTLQNMCTAEGEGLHYPVDKAGVWVDCVHQRRPIIHNDYARLPHRKGMPEGHAPVIRELVVPVFREGLIVAILGVGNKPDGYNDADIEVASQLASMAWDVVLQKRAEDELRKSKEQFERAIKQAPVPMVITDTNQDIVLYNNKFIEVFGYTLEDVSTAEQWWLTVYPDPAYRQRVQQSWEKAIAKAMETGNEIEMQEWDMTRKDRSLRRVEFKMTPLGEISLIAMNDITERKRTEEELRNTLQLLETIFDHTYLMVAYLDPQFNFIRVNRAYAQVDNREPSFFPGKNHFDLYPHEENQAIFRRVVETKEPHFALAKAFEYAEHPERGTSHWDWSLVPVKDSQDNIKGLILVLQNVTRRIRAEEKLRESEARYRALFENSPIALFEEDFSAIKTHLLSLQQAGVTNLQTYFEEHPEEVVHCVTLIKILDVNQAALTLFEATQKEQLLNGPGDQFINRSYVSFKEELIALAKSQRTFRNETCYQTLTGREIKAAMGISIPPKHESTWARVFVYIMDITERKRLESESRKAEILRVELSKEREIAVLRERFISTVTHEFRTPLAVMQTSSDLLLHYFDKLSEDRRKEILQQIREQIANLTDLTASVLTFRRTEAGRTEFAPSPLDIEAFCRDIFEQIQFSDNTRHCFEFISHPPEKPVLADGNLLKHILENLLSNALKYSPDASTIRLELDYDSDNVIFRVSDRGIGIPEEGLPRLFEPFHRASNVGNIEGTGMGLAIVKQYVELHDGSIEVNSKLNQGSTFTIRLPVAQS